MSSTVSHTVIPQTRSSLYAVTIDRLKVYWELTKPRITLLVLLTTFTGMWLAAGGMPGFDLVFMTLLGTGFAAGSSSTLNNFIDRRVDAVMARTAARPLPSGRASASEALILGILLGAASFVLLSLTVNLLTAILAVATILFYVLIYTAWLKRTTTWCTVIGGVAGAVPPVIGWAAVSGDIGWPALLLFILMFVWQPPHFWALAVIRAEEYRRAGLPMLPVVAGEAVTKKKMLVYTAVLLPVSLAFWFLGYGGVIYAITASLSGFLYLLETLRFMRRPLCTDSARRLFVGSLLYLTAIFVAVVVDAVWF